MVYIKSWQEFQTAAEALYAQAPNKTRYCVKWKASEAKLVLKITDDITCLKYKTGSTVYLNRFDALNGTLLRHMRNRTSRLSTIPQTSVNETKSTAGTPEPGGAAAAGTATGGPTAGGGSEKKKKGKKKK